jgi:hypothetical protein
MSLFVVTRLRILNRVVKRIFLQPKCLQPISLNPALLQIGHLKGQLKAWSSRPGFFIPKAPGPAKYDPPYF